MRLAQVSTRVIAEATHGALKRLVHVQVLVLVLGREAVAVLDKVRSRNDVEAMFRPWAVTGAVAGAVRRAVRHEAGLQAAISSDGSVQVQSGNERFANVDSFGPVDWIIIHTDKGALKAYGERQLLLFKEMFEKRINN